MASGKLEVEVTVQMRTPDGGSLTRTARVLERREEWEPDNSVVFQDERRMLAVTLDPALDLEMGTPQFLCVDVMPGDSL